MTRRPPHRKSEKPPHGTRQRYKYHKCRCDECVAAESAYKGDYRSRRRLAEFGVNGCEPCSACGLEFKGDAGLIAHKPHCKGRKAA